MNIVGLSAYFHDSACCLISDGRLVSAAQEERFSRIKHDPALPTAAFRYCLDRAGIDITQVDCVAYYESPVKKLARQLQVGNPEGAPRSLPWLDALRPEREIREVLGHEGRIEFFDHHHSHAASAFDFSGFEDAAILTVDGVGEFATTTLGTGSDAGVEIFDEVEFPHSLGLLYSTITSYLGFRVNNGEYKVMGLAPYGEPRFAEQMRALVQPRPRGRFELDMAYFDFARSTRMYSEALCELLGEPPRVPESEITQFHKDVARSLQVVLEEVLLHMVDALHERVDSPRLCMAGGVALNCVANGRILRDGPFEQMFVQPAAGDAGGCLGAAALAHRKMTGQRMPVMPLQDVYLGPAFESADIARLIDVAGIEASDFRNRESELLAATAERLSRRKVVGWFQGAMEFGPRALGARSILADPRDPGMRDRLNHLVKKREAFRPFAPSVLAEEAERHFVLDHPSPFMLETCRVRSPLDLPAVTHVDRSARPQTVDRSRSPRFAALLDAFHELTGCPLLVNTSFNVRGEPIVCTPEDAIACAVTAGLDCLVLEDFLIDREMIPDGLFEIVRETNTVRRPEAISTVVYTFI